MFGTCQKEIYKTVPNKRIFWQRKNFRCRT